jgi:hypothetical protein
VFAGTNGHTRRGRGSRHDVIKASPAVPIFCGSRFCVVFHVSCGCYQTATAGHGHLSSQGAAQEHEVAHLRPEIGRNVRLEKFALLRRIIE